MEQENLMELQMEDNVKHSDATNKPLVSDIIDVRFFYVPELKFFLGE